MIESWKYNTNQVCEHKNQKASKFYVSLLIHNLCCFIHCSLQQNLTWENPAVRSVGHQEFHLTMTKFIVENISTEIQIVTHETYGYQFPAAVANIVLKRRVGYYIYQVFVFFLFGHSLFLEQICHWYKSKCTITLKFNFVQVFIPSGLMVVTSWVIFWIEMSDGEKVKFCAMSVILVDLDKTACAQYEADLSVPQ